MEEEEEVRANAVIEVEADEEQSRGLEFGRQAQRQANLHRLTWMKLDPSPGRLMRVLPLVIHAVGEPRELAAYPLHIEDHPQRTHAGALSHDARPVPALQGPIECGQGVLVHQQRGQAGIVKSSQAQPAQVVPVEERQQVVRHPRSQHPRPWVMLLQKQNFLLRSMNEQIHKIPSCKQNGPAQQRDGTGPAMDASPATSGPAMVSRGGARV